MKDLSTNSEAVTFKAGGIIFVQGAPSKYLYLVKSGEVRRQEFWVSVLFNLNLFLFKVRLIWEELSKSKPGNKTCAEFTLFLKTLGA